MSEEEGRHVRRTRYRGTHPRHFSEKYKELDPLNYADDIAKVIARGDTPAGSHRSIMVREVLEALSPHPGEVAVDATLGYGGHAREILDRIQPGGMLFGMDRDAGELKKTTDRLRVHLRSSGFPDESFIPVEANFSSLPEQLAERGVAGVDMILMDLGLSSMQIDNPLRGFSYKQKGPLDMRMNPDSGVSARDYLSKVTEVELRDILVANADEGEAARIARAILERRGRLETTRDLAEAICSVFPELPFKDPGMTRTLRRCFQAIRIEVNMEFQSLEILLAALPDCLKHGGRAAILSFHSGEDRRVEASLGAGLAAGIYSSIGGEAMRPGREERYENPRSGAAKLRWAVRG